MTNHGSDRKEYPELEQLGIEALEQLVCEASRSEPMDADYIDRIMEVILRKESESDDYAPADVDAAWQDFVTNYMDKPTGSDDELMDVTSPSVNPDDVSGASVSHKRRKLTRSMKSVLVAAALVVSLLVMQVSGFSLLESLQSFARWTSDVFRFGTQQELEGVVQLKEEMDRLGMSSKFSINWYPDEFTPEPVISHSSSDWNCVFQKYHSNDDAYFSVTIYWFQDETHVSYQTAMTELGDPAVQIHNGLQYDILTNNGETIITWYRGHYTGTITGNLGEEVLLEIFHSIGGIEP